MSVVPGGGASGNGLRAGRFITFEGGEGAGKSTLVAAVAACLRGGGLEVVVTREPGGTPGADLLRGLFARPAEGDPWLPMTEALLVSAARAQHLGRVVLPALARGAWVLCDRYADSTRVYQGAGGGIGGGVLEELIALSTGGLAPDLTLVLDLEPEVAIARIAAARGKRADEVGRYDGEPLAAHAARREAYLGVAARFPERCRVLDAALAPGLLAAAALRALAGTYGREICPVTREVHAAVALPDK